MLAEIRQHGVRFRRRHSRSDLYRGKVVASDHNVGERRCDTDS